MISVEELSIHYSRVQIQHSHPLTRRTRKGPSGIYTTGEKTCVKLVLVRYGIG